MNTTAKIKLETKASHFRVIVPAQCTGARSLTPPESPLELLKRCGGKSLAHLESHPHAFHALASMLHDDVNLMECMPRIDVFCGVPPGGLVLGHLLAEIGNRHYVYLEEVTKGSLEFLRHLDFFRALPRRRVALVQDSLEEISLTYAQEAVGRYHGTVVAIVCVCSAMTHGVFGAIPIIELP